MTAQHWLSMLSPFWRLSWASNQAANRSDSTTNKGNHQHVRQPLRCRWKRHHGNDQRDHSHHGGDFRPRHVPDGRDARHQHGPCSQAQGGDLMRPPLAMVLVLILAREGFDAKWTYLSDFKWIVFPYVEEPIRHKFPIQNITDTIILSVATQPYVDPQGFIIIGSGDSPTGWTRTISQVQDIINYEKNNCNNETLASGPNYYVAAINRFRQLWCKRDGSTVPGHPTDTVFACFTNPQFNGYTGFILNPVRANGVGHDFVNWFFSCGDRNAIVGSGPGAVYIHVTRTAITNTCEYTSDANCRSCSWPYLSVRDTVGCGCVVDYSKLQSEQDLRKKLYLYCNTYSDGSGAQYYEDQYRSNFDPTKGEIFGACSSPVTGKVVYMPAESCPAGSALDSIDSAKADSLGARNAAGAGSAAGGRQGSGSGSGSGTGSDTATHSRLDSIIGRLDTILARMSGVGADTSVIGYLDTVGAGNADTGYFSSEARDAKAGLDTALNGLPALTSAVSDHASRGDTSGVAGYTLDSLINLCVTNGDSSICLSQQTIYPTIIQVAKWIIRVCLFIWGLLMFAFFLSLAKGD